MAIDFLREKASSKTLGSSKTRKIYFNNNSIGFVNHDVGVVRNIIGFANDDEEVATINGK